MRFFYRLQLTR